MKVEIYYNLNKHILSVRQKGIVIKHTPAAEVFNAKFVVQPAGRKRVLREKRKNVHAFIRGTAGRLSKTILSQMLGRKYKVQGNWVRVTYNPYKYNSFVEADTGEPIHESAHVVISGRIVYAQKKVVDTKSILQYKRTMTKTRRERPYDETVCLQRDSLDLYVDGVLIESAPINTKGMETLKKSVDNKMKSGTLFQIRIRNSVQWESIPTHFEDGDGYWEGLLKYEKN